MLSETSYQLAIACYVGAATLALLYLGWILSRSWRPGWVSLVVLLGAVLLLTPAYPQEGVDTLAPALIVVAFQSHTGRKWGVPDGMAMPSPSLAKTTPNTFWR